MFPTFGPERKGQAVPPWVKDFLRSNCQVDVSKVDLRLTFVRRAKMHNLLVYFAPLGWERTNRLLTVEIFEAPDTDTIFDEQHVCSLYPTPEGTLVLQEHRLDAEFGLMPLALAIYRSNVTIQRVAMKHRLLLLSCARKTSLGRLRIPTPG